MEILTTKEDYWKARATELEKALQDFMDADTGCGCCSYDSSLREAREQAEKLLS